MSEPTEPNETTEQQPDPWKISAADSGILRRLAGKVAELAARPIEAEKRELWYRHNALEPTRPPIFCSPENAWYEILPPEKVVQCANGTARDWEYRLRTEIFWGESMCDDRVIEPYFNVPHIMHESDWGVPFNVTRPSNPGGSFIWDAPVKDLNDLSQLHFPTFNVDYDGTERRLELAQNTFGDLLQVRLKSLFFWGPPLSCLLAYMRGLEQFMIDMVDNPKGLHRLMAFLRDGMIDRLEFLERERLLFLNNEGDYIGSGGFGFTRELPQPDFAGVVRPCDMWVAGESQETSSVSPSMFEEFIFQYQLPILSRFGLNHYGCCEPLDTRWHVVAKTPRLRRVSIPPWSDIAGMAEKLQDRYIYSWKPNPTILAMESFDESLIRSYTRDALEKTRGCRLEIIMKDNHTIRNETRRVIRWVEIVREEEEKLA